MPLDQAGSLLWIIGVLLLSTVAGHVIAARVGAVAGLGVALVVLGVVFDLAPSFRRARAGSKDGG